MDEKIAELIRFTLVTGAITYLLTRSAIFTLYRVFVGSKHIWLRVLVYCPACTGFWVGLAAWRMWPWSDDVIINSALASCLLGSVLSSVWGSDTVDAELEALQHGSQKREEENGS